MPTTFIRRNPREEYHFETIDLDTFRVTRPTVFCFSGNGAITTREANGTCKIVEHQLRLLFDEKSGFNLYDNVDLVGVVYGLSPKSSPSLNDAEIFSFVESVFYPLCFDKSGNLLDMDSILRSMSLVNFFTFCHGSIEASNIIMCLIRDFLVPSNVSREDICKIVGAITHISFAPNTKCVACPSVLVTSFRDNNALDDLELYEENFGVLDGIDVTYNSAYSSLGEVDEYKHFPHIHIYSSNLNNIGKRYFNNEHHLLLMDRNYDWNGVIDRPNGDNIDFGRNADAVSQMMSYALCSSIENGLANMHSSHYIPKIEISELYKDLLSIKNSFPSYSLLSFD